MFFKSLINTISYTYNSLNSNDISNANPNIVKYFKNEYGADWKGALEHHLYEERVKNDKKAA